MKGKHPSGISQGKPWLIRGHSSLYPSVFCLKKVVQSPFGMHFLDILFAMDKHRHSGWATELGDMFRLPRVFPLETKLIWKSCCLGRDPCAPNLRSCTLPSACILFMRTRFPPSLIHQPHCRWLEHVNSGARLQPQLLSASSGLVSLSPCKMDMIWPPEADAKSVLNNLYKLNCCKLIHTWQVLIVSWNIQCSHFIGEKIEAQRW